MSRSYANESSHPSRNWSQVVEVCHSPSSASMFLRRRHWTDLVPLLGPGGVDRSRRVSCDLEHRAVMVGEHARIVDRVLLHELDYLKRTALAVDVRESDLRFERRLGSFRVHEQAVGKN